ncbi:MAG: metallophosphoesterase family protein [bacterium]
MKVVAVSDMHGTLAPVSEIITRERPELLLCAGDWGDESEVSQDDFEKVTAAVTTFSVFGNHDHLALLQNVTNRDGSPVLLENGDVRVFRDITIGGINGIWAKSHKKSFYVTEEDVASAAARLSEKRVDILMTHECPIGMADLTLFGTHGGRRCFTGAFKAVRPKLYLCGHLHRKGFYKTRDGSLVVNIGFTKEGDYAVFHLKNAVVEFESKVI